MDVNTRQQTSTITTELRARNQVDAAPKHNIGPENEKRPGVVRARHSLRDAIHSTKLARLLLDNINESKIKTMTKLSWEQLKQWDQDDLINYIETLQDDCEQHIKNNKKLQDIANSRLPSNQ